MIMSVDALVYNIVHVKYESLLAFFRPWIKKLVCEVLYAIC